MTAWALIERAFWAAAPWALGAWLYFHAIVMACKWMRWRRHLEMKRMGIKEDGYER
jgi:hypothetical protein